MSKHMVKLRASQQSVRPFRHELLDNAVAPEPGDVELLIGPALVGDREARDKLILVHLAMLRHTIGRYLYHWPITRRFIDDMVSAGLLAMTRAVGNLTPSKLTGQTIGQYLLNNICKHVEDEIAKLRGICPPSSATNWRYVQQGRDPFYGDIEPASEDTQAYMEPGFEEFDVKDGLEQLKSEAGIAAQLLDEALWGLSSREIAERLGVNKRAVERSRAELLKRYHELVGDADE